MCSEAMWTIIHLYHSKELELLQTDLRTEVQSQRAVSTELALLKARHIQGVNERERLKIELEKVHLSRYDSEVILYLMR